MEIATIRSPTSFPPGRVGENPGNGVVITNQLAGRALFFRVFEARHKRRRTHVGFALAYISAKIAPVSLLHSPFLVSSRNALWAPFGSADVLLSHHAILSNESSRKNGWRRPENARLGGYRQGRSYLFPQSQEQQADEKKWTCRASQRIQPPCIARRRYGTFPAVRFPSAGNERYSKATLRGTRLIIVPLFWEKIGNFSQASIVSLVPEIQRAIFWKTNGVTIKSGSWFSLKGRVC